MKLELLQENLAKALNIVSRVIPSKAQLPILSHILISAKDGVLSLTGSDSQTTIVTTCGAKLVTEGDYTVPFRSLQEIVNSLPADKLTLEKTAEEIVVTSGKYSAKIRGTSASEYPNVVPVDSEASSWQIPTEKILKISAQTTFASALDESRAVLTGVLLKIEKDSLTAVATDGFRLSLVRLGEITGGKKTEKSELVIIPARSIGEIARLLADAEDADKKTDKKSEINFSLLESNQLLIDLGTTKIYTSVISGNFPDFEKIIPTNSTVKLSVSADELLRAVKISAVFARENANIIKLKLAGSSTVEIFSQGGQTGENTVSLDADYQTKNSEELTISFNYHYIQDFLTSIGSEEEITMEFSGPVAPGIFRPKSDDSYLHIIMPVRIQN